MQAASLPVLYTVWNEKQLNILHGYTVPMEAAYVRDTIAPVGEDRSLSLVIKTYGETVTGGSFALRSLDGDRFLEEQELDLTGAAEEIPLEVQLTALLEDDTEYRMELTLSTESYQEIHYYLRVMASKDWHVEELLEFAGDFSQATLDKAVARELIVPYLLPNETQTNDSFAYANQHSSFATITWGELEMNRLGDPVYQISELTKTQLSVTLEYQLQAADSEGVLRQYQVQEFFCVRWRDGKLYLLSYERKADQVFQGKQNEIKDGMLWLGITDGGSAEVVADDEASCIVLNYGGELWAYDSEKNEMMQLFSYREDTKDLRNDYDQHAIHVMRMDEEKNVYFMVYGYMNRGAHQGEVGISFYRFDYENNRIQELYYIPAGVAYQILKESINALSYVNEDNLCYFLYGDTIYSIDLSGSECQSIASDVQTNSYAISDDGSVIVWQVRDEDGPGDSIRILNMQTGNTTELRAEPGEYLVAEGFLKNDLVYGKGRISDIVTEAGVETLFPLYSIQIMGMEDQTIQETYQYPDIYVTEVAIENDRIRLSRVGRSAEGSLEPMEADTLILNDAEEASDTGLHTVQDALGRRCYYVNLGNASKKGMHFSTIRPTFDLDANTSRITIEGTDPKTDVSYYVYGFGGVLGVYDNLRTAIGQAYDALGVVVSGELRMCWNRDSRDLIVNLSVTEGEPRAQSLAAGIELLLSGEGIAVTGCEEKLAAGESPVEILEEAVGDRAVDLYGCTLPQVLYYLNLKQPVLAVTGDSTGYVIVGYTSNTVTLYDPATAQRMEWNMGEAETFFAERGNRFGAIMP